MAGGKKRGKRPVPQKQESEALQQKMKDEIIEFILQGYPMSEVVDYLQLNYNIQYENARKYYKTAHASILELGDFDIERIITQHIFYYEEAARFFDSIGNYSAKAQAMNAKEKLLKIFEEDEPDIEIENNVNVNVEQLNYDIGKLNAKELDRFSEIFKKVKFIDANKQ